MQPHETILFGVPFVTGSIRLRISGEESASESLRSLDPRQNSIRVSRDLRLSVLRAARKKTAILNKNKISKAKIKDFLL